MAELYVLTVLMGAFLLAVAAAVATSGRWRAFTPSAPRYRPADRSSSLTSIARNPTIWVLAFVLAVAVVGAATFLIVAGGELELADSVVAGLQLALLAVAGLAFVLYLLYGTFLAVRSRGGNDAEAVGAGLTLLGILFIVAITAHLLSA